MKINAKFAALAGAAVLAGAGAFAQATDDYNLPKGFKFSSKISSDVIYNTGNMHADDASDRGADMNYHSELAGLYQTISISYSSEKFAFALNPKWGLLDWNENLFDSNSGYGHTNKLDKSKDNLNADDLGFAWKEAKFDIRFSPFDIVDFYLNQDVFTAGSNLLARGKQLGNGNLQGEGVGVILKPIDGLRLAADVPFKINFVSNPNFLNAEWDDGAKGSAPNHTAGKATKSSGTAGWFGDSYKFRVDVGADYTVGGLTVGGSVVNLVSRADRGYGLYAAFKSGAFQANVGYTYKDADNGYAGIDFFDTFGLVRVSGTHLVNASAQAKLGDITLALDVLTNLVKFGTQSVYDLGAMFKVDYAMVPGKFNLGMKVGAAFDLKADPSTGSLAMAQKTTKLKKDFGDDMAFKSKDINDDHAISGDYNKKAAIALFLNPNFTYKTGKNTFTGAANLVYFLNGDGSYACKFPVAWTYAF